MTAPTPHDHAERVQGCFRCEIGRDEVTVSAAVERGAEVMHSRLYWAERITFAEAKATMHESLAAALDVEEMARVLNGHEPAPADDLDARVGLRNGCSCGRMDSRENRQAHVATALHAAILGSDR